MIVVSLSRLATYKMSLEDIEEYLSTKGIDTESEYLVESIDDGALFKYTQEDRIE